jgi:hypothetical protein
MAKCNKCEYKFKNLKGDYCVWDCKKFWALKKLLPCKHYKPKERGAE